MPARIAKRLPILLLLVAAACGGAEPDRVPGLIQTGSARIELTVEIADSEEERLRGLMGRESLPERSGILFVHEADTNGSFWMKDTLVPVSIAFIAADGRILEILDMEPCAADPCPLYSPGVRYRLALEVNRGAFSRWGVAVGDVFSLSGS
jgi:uncharacterized membrane protein (UPF0127 family)